MDYFVQEWQALQKQIDDFEKWSLIIKISNVFVTVILFTAGKMSFIAGSIILIMWLQDGIWKTFQSRTELRLLSVERIIEYYGSSKDTTAEHPFQLNREFSAGRPSTLGLVIAYLKQSLRPTVAFPHVALVSFYFYQLIMS